VWLHEATKGVLVARTGRVEELFLRRGRAWGLGGHCARD
jgi:hypothetical protein